MENVTVLFLGPCRKFDSATGKPFPAFSPSSRSGRFLRSVLDAAALPSNVQVKFDNVIPRPVFRENGQERNPSCAELVLELENHSLWRLGAGDIVIGLSSVVGEALRKVSASRTASGRAVYPMILGLEHPSFMMRRPVRERVDYAKRIDGYIKGAATRYDRGKNVEHRPTRKARSMRAEVFSEMS